jgi:hypothetical protein
MPAVSYNVQVTLDKTAYGMGNNVNFKVAVTDAATNRPASQPVFVSIFAVDASTYMGNPVFQARTPTNIIQKLYVENELVLTPHEMRHGQDIIG